MCRLAYFLKLDTIPISRRNHRTDYVLEVPAKCLQCGVEITEKTLVEWEPNSG